LVHEIVGIKAMPVVSDEAHGRLAGAGKIENRLARTLLQRRAELIQPVTVTILQNLTDPLGS
jgi:hypothetical protein